MEIKINVEKFVHFHKKRISLLKEFVEKKTHGRIIYQICFLGFESLASLLYQEERDSQKRFILALSNILKLKGRDLEELCIWRNSLIHEGFVALPYNTLEGWSEYDISFLSYPDNMIKSSEEYPPESIIAMYDDLIDYFDDYFKKKDTKEIILPYQFS